MQVRLKASTVRQPHKKSAYPKVSVCVRSGPPRAGDRLHDKEVLNNVFLSLKQHC